MAQARDALQAAIRAAPDGSAAFTAALVANLDDRLVVLPGAAGVAVRIAAPPAGRAGLLALALESDRPAIAANDGGDRPGPAATIERSTLFGPVHVAELAASESLFTAPLLVERRQTGCLRFCYAPLDARTPRRFRCQPDGAVAAAIAAAERERGGALTGAERERLRFLVEQSVVPVFTAARYGRPAFGQLAQSCPEAVSDRRRRRGRDGRVPLPPATRRLANLTSQLDSYLRFGLEAGSASSRREVDA